MNTIIPTQRREGERITVQNRRLVVTIDGPAGVGKSTTANALALRLGYMHLDSGALYRAVAWKINSENVSPAQLSQVDALLSKTSLQLISHKQGISVFVDSQDVSKELRTLAISQVASSVAALQNVRDWLLPIQREFGMKGGIVAEGRDMGTQVFPQADVKFFLEADLDIRASRRHLELRDKRIEKESWEEVRHKISDRDVQDRSRGIAPLIPAQDAVIINTSRCSADQVVNRMVEVIEHRL